MIWAIATILALLWVVGLLLSYSLGGYIHLLLAAAIVLLIVAAYKMGAHSRRRRGAPEVRPRAPADKADMPNASIAAASRDAV